MVATNIGIHGEPTANYTLKDVLNLHLKISFQPLPNTMYLCEVGESYTAHTQILKNTYIKLSEIKSNKDNIGYTSLNKQKDKLITQIDKRIINSETKKTFQREVSTLEKILENL